MAGKDVQKVSGWLFHTVVWAALLALPFFSILPGQPIVDGRDYLHFVVMMLSFMAVFYANWFLLIPRYLFHKRIGRFVMWNVAFVLVVTLILHLVFRSLLPPVDSNNLPPIEPRWYNILRFLVGNTFLYLLVALVCVAIRMTGEWYLAESRRKDLEKSRTEAELQNLNSQLNPHFLFNTLNNIYSLIQLDPQRAQDAVHDLSQLLRYVLYDSAQASVPVEKEMTFLRDYIALMRIRLPRHVDLDVSFPEAPSSREIAPMLFISPIENAFKHGVSHDEASFIEIHIDETESALVCDIRNSNHPKADDDRSGSGIGLKNLEQRLEMIYPGRYAYTHGASEGIYKTHLEVPL